MDSVNNRNKSLENDLMYLRERIATLTKDLNNNA